MKTHEQAEAAYIAGQRMSNWLYNMAQHYDFKKLSAQMSEMVRAWDNSKTFLAKLTVPPAKRKKAARRTM